MNEWILVIIKEFEELQLENKYISVTLSVRALIRVLMAFGLAIAFQMSFSFLN